MRGCDMHFAFIESKLLLRVLPAWWGCMFFGQWVEMGVGRGGLGGRGCVIVVAGRGVGGWGERKSSRF